MTRRDRRGRSRHAGYVDVIPWYRLEWFEGGELPILAFMPTMFPELQEAWQAWKRKHPGCDLPADMGKDHERHLVLEALGEPFVRPDSQWTFGADGGGQRSV